MRYYNSMKRLPASITFLTALLFLGGINLLAAVKFAVSPSEEEKLVVNLSVSDGPQPRAAVGVTIPLGG